ncbi:carboxylesterase/lipase family protein [Hymenobacter terricola]|uniref:carboxylesterase/lipase family protein n=1 Tax=Hymenobacter terricola TaxID=2819236 RepID=UPI001B30B8A2|nr:carboxylesterase family protein [Hymenobacter terricola]
MIYQPLSHRLRPCCVRLLLLILGTASTRGYAQPPAGPVVKTHQGKVQGVQEGALRVFRGIAYAQAPVGTLRFQPPQPLPRRKGVRAAVAFGARALQAGGAAGVQGGEDCLYLNVWAPALPKKARRPVVVWVHGGAFTGGSGQDNDTWTFAAQDTIVAVSFNYRLGALGFLQLGNRVGAAYAQAGNCGLLDAVAALRWVHDNIQAFGGDPDRVTVMGESAGAKLIGGLLATPAARPLFRQVILESGAVQAVRDTATASAVTRQLLQELHLPSARALLTLPAEDIIRAQGRFTANNSGLQAFGPVLDGAIIPAPPLDYLRRTALAPLRVLLGSNLEEAGAFTGPGSVMHEPSESALQQVFGTQNSRYVWRAYQQRLAQADPAAWRNTLTDYLYRMATYRLANALAARQVPVWLYRFDWSNATTRPTHAQELAFVWDAPQGTTAAATVAAPGAPRKAADPALAAAMHAHWARFIKTGQPGPTWPAYTEAEKRVLIFDANSRSESIPAPYEDPAFPVQGYAR